LIAPLFGFFLGNNRRCNGIPKAAHSMMQNAAAL
jgi:hypothetical protein